MYSSTIFIIATFVCLSSCLRNNIVNFTRRESWISVENLKSLIQVSFDSTQCCNLLLSGNSKRIENLYEDFLKFYPNAYTLNSINYDCYANIIMSKSVESVVVDVNKVPTAFLTTTILILLDDDIDESEAHEIFNVSMYEDANVNIVSSNGLWSLSEIHFVPRLFKKTSSYDEMMHKQGVVNFQGREIRAATIYCPPASYLETWTVNRSVKGVDEKFFIAQNSIGNNKTELDGVEVQLFLLLAEKLNFTWTLRRPSDDYRYGIKNDSTWTGGLIGQLYQNEVDIAFGSIFLLLENRESITMTTPSMRVALHFLVPRPKPYTSFWALTRPLSPEVWAAVLLMLVLQSGFVYIKALVQSRTSQRFRSFVVTWTELLGRLIGTFAPRKILGFKLQFQLWHMIGILVVTAYSSSLAASLTSSHYEERIDTVEQFVTANLTWGTKAVADRWHFTVPEDDDDDVDFERIYFEKLEELWVPELNESDRHKRILQGNHAVLGKTLDMTFYPEAETTNEELKGLRLMRDHVDHFYTSFAVQPWLLESINSVLHQLRASGLLAYHIHDVIHRRTSPELREVLVEHDVQDNRPRVLKLVPLGAGFAILFIGLFISTIVLVFELK